MFAIIVFPNLRGLVIQIWRFPALTYGNSSLSISVLSTKYALKHSLLYKVYGVMLFKYVPIVLAPFQHNYLFLYILLYMMADIFTSQLQNLLQLNMSTLHPIYLITQWIPSQSLPALLYGMWLYMLLLPITELYSKKKAVMHPDMHHGFSYP